MTLSSNPGPAMPRRLFIALAAVATAVALCVTLLTATRTTAQDVVVVESDRPASSSDSAQPVQTLDISLEQAEAIIAAAKQKAMDMDLKMDIAIVDAGGNLKAFVRMDGAWLGSIDIAIKKAKTARYFDMPTGDIGKLSQPGQPLYAIEHSNDGLITFPGGIPLKAEDGTVIGAIGVSGSTVDNDQTVATAGVEAL